MYSNGCSLAKTYSVTCNVQIGQCTLSTVSLKPFKISGNILTVLSFLLAVISSDVISHFAISELVNR
jgi:hypothetical protein